ncbi:MAG: hypothetical protein ACSHW1_13450 [Yoonia sp.]|uniref:hypothetical protein n=1 Tax=Yoonia sp. TaxID=2212373 RepID=UPI003EF86B16
MNQLHTVLTGDLIKSRQATSADIAAAFDCLQQTATDFGQVWDIDLRFTRFRGDGWQVVLDVPGLTLHAIIHFTATLRAAKPDIATRIAAGVGTTDSLGTADLSDATGPAFFISGDHLDGMSPKRRLALAGQGIGTAQCAIIDLTEFITLGWTAGQAQAVALAIQDYPRTHDEIAQDLGITRQAVQSRLAGAGFAYFENALYAIRNHDFTTAQAD